MHRDALATVVLAAVFCFGGSGAVMAEADADAGVALPPPIRSGGTSVEDALARRRSVRAYADAPLRLAAVSQLVWAAQGITDPDGLRTAPSAGALYPLEVYLVAGSVTGLRSGVYRYDPRRHRLLLHAAGDPRKALSDAALEQEWVAEAPVVLVLAAVYERSAHKYGERAPRYVHIEVGHAAQNVYLQAVALELGTVMVGAFHDRALKEVLRLPSEVEPLGVMPVGKPR
ncbi:MAG: SagB/ThcOx family dehydrogenase [Deltaproteobacteria bacterium]|nr:MAG: SagB/ThcOx family dehydrogenase [Deltaproteobacteria bacterium]